jgi:ABC-type antimicrobial peptide transport system permease subunit
MLEAAALIAILLALLALVLGAVAERRDEAAESFDLEAQGAPPARLRRQLQLRALVVAAAGALGGIVTGLVLSLLVVSFVELTANATTPVPPLELSVDWLVVLLSTLVALALGVVLVWLYTGRAFRERVPPRYGEAG